MPLEDGSHAFRLHERPNFNEENKPFYSFEKDYKNYALVY
jgi:hypothetical protein